MKADNDRISEYLSHLAVEKALASNTLSSYSRDLVRFCEFLDAHSLGIDSVTSEVMSEYVAWLRGKNSGRAPLAESSIARAVVSVRNFYRFDAKESHRVDPIHDFHPPKIPKRLPKALTISEVNALIDGANRPSDPLSLRDVALVELLYATGGRISEIVGLALRDVSELAENGNLAIRLKGKGGKDRIVPVGSFARKALEDYLVRLRPVLVAAKRNDGLFLNQRGQRISRQSAWKIVTLAAQRAKISREVSPHSLRHSFATHLLDGGADIRVVQELLGHSSVTTTQIYTLITIDKLRESYSAAHPRAR
ncbi:MAG: site-specific tyrosine recombinase XerD [Actinomycetes bacterium]